jgi:hypothetical protein
MGDTVITEKGIVDKDTFFLPKRLVDKFDGHTLWLLSIVCDVEDGEDDGEDDDELICWA